MLKYINATRRILEPERLARNIHDACEYGLIIETITVNNKTFTVRFYFYNKLNPKQIHNGRYPKTRFSKTFKINIKFSDIILSDYDIAH